MIAVKLLDGPEGGAVIFGGKDEPADEIAVFRTQIAMPGTLVYAATDTNEVLPGDAIYRKVSRSDLFDQPGVDLAHPNLGVGCAYQYVRTSCPSAPDSEPGPDQTRQRSTASAPRAGGPVTDGKP